MEVNAPIEVQREFVAFLITTKIFFFLYFFGLFCIYDNKISLTKKKKSINHSLLGKPIAIQLQDYISQNYKIVDVKVLFFSS